MKKTLIVYFAIFTIFGCEDTKTQSRYPTFSESKLIGTCEGCEAIFEYGDQEIGSDVELPGFSEPGTKIRVSGKILKSNGTDPASNVILYLYHTNSEGIYPKTGSETRWARQHGALRGWVKSDENGNYSFKTIRPASYPNSKNPQHIHVTLLEPDGKYYWLNSFHFDDDINLKEDRREAKNPRGGKDFILHLVKKGEIYVAEANIILGYNVEGYEN